MLEVARGQRSSARLHTPFPGGPAMPRLLLEAITSLAMSLVDAPPDGPALIHLAPNGADLDALDLGVRPLDGHPLDVLVGFTAPAEWYALGLVVSGTARSLEPRCTGPPRRVVTSIFVTRDGDI